MSLLRIEEIAMEIHQLEKRKRALLQVLSQTTMQEFANHILEYIKSVRKTVRYEDIVSFMIDTYEVGEGSVASLLCGLSVKKLIFSPRLGYFKAT